MVAHSKNQILTSISELRVPVTKCGALTKHNRNMSCDGPQLVLGFVHTHELEHSY